MGKKKFELDVEIQPVEIFIIALHKTKMLLNGFLMGINLKERGKYIFIGKNTSLKCKKRIRFGNSVTIEDFVRIDGLTKKGIKIGNNVTIKAGCVIDSGLLSDIGEGVSIGNNVGISQGCFIQSSGFVEIHDNVIIGPHSCIYSEIHKHTSLDKHINEQGVIRKKVTIGKGAWIGSKAVILYGVTIGEGAIIAAGAVVTKNVQPFSIYAGIPAVKIKERKH